MNISLTGGLGNQLFQLAFALSRKGKGELVILSNLGKPRLARTGQPELVTLFNGDEDFKISSKGGNLLAQKSIGYILRMGIAPKRWEINLTKWFIRKVGSSVLSLSLGRRVAVREGHGVGYFESPAISKIDLLCGYFQSYRWASIPEVYSQLMKLEPPVRSKKLQDLIERATRESPVIVHVRLGDYLSESAFGIPSADYYSRGIETAAQVSGSKNIWIYSDSIDIAKQTFPTIEGLSYSWIEEVEFSASQTFQSMRYGSAYVIANSTFSWWAAFLRYESKAIVIAPDPWFKFADDPKDLIPKEWVVFPA